MCILVNILGPQINSLASKASATKQRHLHDDRWSRKSPFMEIVSVLLSSVQNYIRLSEPLKSDPEELQYAWIIHLLYILLLQISHCDLSFSDYPAERRKKDSEEVDMGVAGTVNLLQNVTLSTQPIASLDWSPDKQGLCVCSAFDQSVRVLIVTKLNRVWDKDFLCPSAIWGTHIHTRICFTQSVMHPV